jgi:hypothetical protein
MDVYAKPESVDERIVENLGPFAPLAGTWQGDDGIDVAPARSGPAETRVREHMTLEPMGPVLNGPQVLYGLRYRTTAWPLGEENPFHEEVGYWLWDPAAEIAMRHFIVPRGVAVSAGGPATADARSFEMKAEVGSETFGVLSNPFLDEAFKTLRFEVRITVHDGDSFSYAEDTVLQIAGAVEPFHHTDQNTLRRV